VLPVLLLPTPAVLLLSCWVRPMTCAEPDKCPGPRLGEGFELGLPEDLDQVPDCPLGLLELPAAADTAS
jgi:hypothetical protein